MIAKIQEKCKIHVIKIVLNPSGAIKTGVYSIFIIAYL